MNQSFSYVHPSDCAPHIQQQLDQHSAHGGLVLLSNGEYNIAQPVVLEGTAATTTTVVGVPEERIIRKP